MTFKHREGGLSLLGPTLDVRLGQPSRLRQALPSAAVVPPIHLKLLIDPGATVTSIKSDAFKWLRLSSHERSAINTPSTTTPHPVDVWEADLILDEQHVFRNLRVFGCHALHMIDGLLGRDVLQHGVFSYEGLRKCWSIELHPPVSIVGKKT